MSSSTTSPSPSLGNPINRRGPWGLCRKIIFTVIFQDQGSHAGDRALCLSPLCSVWLADPLLVAVCWSPPNSAPWSLLVSLLVCLLISLLVSPLLSPRLSPHLSSSFSSSLSSFLLSVSLHSSSAFSNAACHPAMC